MLNEKSSGFKRVILDCEGYRQKREKTLKKLAGNIEQKVKRTGVAVSLEPMNPYERRIIHTALQNSKYVTTESEGQGVNRHIVVSPKNQSNILNAINAPRKTLNFVYRSVTPCIKRKWGGWRDTLIGVSRQFYSPVASDIATQWYSARAEWYSLREFQGE